MGSTLVKGLSVAFAAAMAVTAFAPATVSEAASTKATVVSKLIDTEGYTHKYTYDSRGRIVKEVITKTDATEEWEIQGTKSTTNLGTIKYQIVAADGTTVLYDNSTNYQLSAADEVIKASETTDFEAVYTTTYYNSGAKKDQKKAVTGKIKESLAYVYDSNKEGRDGAYGKIREESDNWTYAYDSKGVNVSSENTYSRNNNWVYVHTSGINYEDIYVWNTTTNSFVNLNGQKYDDIKAADKYAECFNGANYINDVNLTTIKYAFNKRNSLGLPTDVDINQDTYSSNPSYNVKADGSGEYKLLC